MACRDHSRQSLNGLLDTPLLLFLLELLALASPLIEALLCCTPVFLAFAGRMLALGLRELS